MLSWLDKRQEAYMQYTSDRKERRKQCAQPGDPPMHEYIFKIYLGVLGLAFALALLVPSSPFPGGPSIPSIP